MDLMSTRWQLNQVHSMLDVGCGVGHWGRLLAPYLSKDAQITGIDQEPEWIAKCKNSSIARPASYFVSDAMKLPFADNSFDMVTCQTVLIHLKEPIKAIQEFQRVLKPNGLLAVAEPNNIVQELIFNSGTINLNIEEKINMIRFQMTCDFGKINLGHGNNSVGDFIPEYFSKNNFKNIQTYTSDKTWTVFPDYSSAQQQIMIQDSLLFLDQECYVWDKDETLKYFLAGGGNAENFETHWKFAMKLKVETKKLILDKNFYSAGGQVFYLVSGRK